jgi:hypothetical protein
MATCRSVHSSNTLLGYFGIPHLSCLLAALETQALQQNKSEAVLYLCNSGNHMPYWKSRIFSSACFRLFLKKSSLNAKTSFYYVDILYAGLLLQTFAWLFTAR